MPRKPPNWKQITATIRDRDGHRCAWCGAPNGERGARDRHGQWHEERAIHNLNSSIGEALFGGFPETITIVLVVAHIDHNLENNDESNLVALCQRCHLRHTAAHRAVSARESRAKKRFAAIQGQGQLALFSEGEAE